MAKPVVTRVVVNLLAARFDITGSSGRLHRPIEGLRGVVLASAAQRCCHGMVRPCRSAFGNEARPNLLKLPSSCRIQANFGRTKVHSAKCWASLAE